MKYKKKNYIFTAPAVWPMIEYELDIAQKILDKKEKVYWVRCEGDDSFCPANIYKKKRICAECISKSNNAIKWIIDNQNFYVIKKKIELTSHQRQKFKNILLNFHDTTKLKKNDIIFNDWKNTVISTIQTTAKKFFLDVDLNNQVHFNVVKNVVESFYLGIKYLKNINNTEVYIFNGRMSGYRPIMRICQNNKIPMYTYEFPLQGYKRYFLCKNNYSHDLIFKSKEFLKFYNNHYFSEINKILLGKKWFDNRIYKKFKMGVEENFSKYQIVGKIPEYMKKENKIKILISLSTEWELGGVTENKRYFFENQYNSVKQIINYFRSNSNFLFVIKTHPQHKNFDKKLELDYQKLGAYENVKIILSSDLYDTYSIIEKSNLVITFISLTGPESAYLGKKVICIGPSSYETFELSSNPKTPNELFELLSNFKKNQNYNSKNASINACKWAFARSWIGTKPKYIYKNKLNQLFMIRNATKYKVKSNFIYKTYNNFFKIYYLFKYLFSKKKINYSNYKKIFNVFKNNPY